MGLGISIAGNGWLLRERERRLSISADVVTQLVNAYIGSPAEALDVVAKHNTLGDWHETLRPPRPKPQPPQQSKSSRSWTLTKRAKTGALHFKRRPRRPRLPRMPPQCWRLSPVKSTI